MKPARPHNCHSVHTVHFEMSYKLLTSTFALYCMLCIWLLICCYMFWRNRHLQGAYTNIIETSNIKIHNMFIIVHSLVLMQSEVHYHVDKNPATCFYSEPDLSNPHFRFFTIHFTIIFPSTPSGLCHLPQPCIPLCSPPCSPHALSSLPFLLPLVWMHAFRISAVQYGHEPPYSS